MDLPERFQDYLRRDPAEPIFEIGGTWHRRQELVDIADALARIFHQAGIDAGTPVGLLARNRVPQVSALIALIAARRGIVMLHAYQPPAALGADFAASRFAAIIADAADWESPPLRDGARQGGSIGIALTHDPADPVRLVPGLETLGPPPRHLGPAAPGIEVLTSGTTGPPKRIPLSYATLSESARDAGVASAQAGTDNASTEKPYVQFYPLGNISGIYGLLLNIAEGRRVAMTERFTVEEWVRLMRTYRPTTFVSLPPAALRMVVEANVDRDVFASVTAMRVGSAPLDPALQEAFEERYGIPVLVNYGATEFCGVVANWTLEDHRQFARLKRGSVGRARPGIGLRVVDAETGATLPAGALGTLEVLVPRIADHWIRTTDLAIIDADGFLFLQGRSDSVIIRGGFKIIPETVAAVLRRHPAVADAAIIAQPDPRLGEVPVAFIEIRAGAEPPTPEALRALAREFLAPQQVPVEFRLTAALPRTGSLKVDRGALRKLVVNG